MLKDLIKAKGITPYRLSVLSGVDTSVVYKYLDKSMSRSTLETAAKLAKALGVSLDDFWKEVRG